MAKVEKKPITAAQEKNIVEAKSVLASKQDVLIKIGQAQAFNFVGKLLTVSELKLLHDIKESKAYKGLTHTDENGKVQTVSTWDECCQNILGSSRQHIDERLKNLHQFGEEFFEQSQKMQLGYRDLRALRQLPDEQQALIIESEAVEIGDKDAVKEMIQELKDHHNKEISSLKEEAKATEAMLKANRQMSNKTVIELQQVKEQLEQKKFSPDKWKLDVKEFFESMASVHQEMEQSLNKILSLNEQLDLIEMDERAREASTSAWYANNKAMLERLAHGWNEIYRTWGHLDDMAKPSGEWLAELGFEGMEEVL